MVLEEIIAWRAISCRQKSSHDFKTATAPGSMVPEPQRTAKHNIPMQASQSTTVLVLGKDTKGIRSCKICYIVQLKLWGT